VSFSNCDFSGSLVIPLPVRQRASCGMVMAVLSLFVAAYGALVTQPGAHSAEGSPAFSLGRGHSCIADIARRPRSRVTMGVTAWLRDRERKSCIGIDRKFYLG